MKRLQLIGICILLLFMLPGCGFIEFPILSNENSSLHQSSGTVVESPPPSEWDGQSLYPNDSDEMRAVWITQFELNPIRSPSESSFRSSFADMMKNCADFGLNTVFVQVRPNGDSFYPSLIYPWSVYVNGAAGEGVSYDPLAIMVEQAHRYHLKIHAWINPYRLQPENHMKSISDTYQTRKWYDLSSSSDRVVTLSGICYLNPGYAEARELIVEGVKEIVSNYQVDGIHIDDYFYPTTEQSFDKKAYAINGKGKSLDEFRFDNVNQTIQGIYTAIKELKPDVVFGVSPAGNMANNTTKLYADTKKWTANTGYLDYIIPQIYWNYEHPSLPFGATLTEWNASITVSGIKIVSGLAPYKIDRGEWDSCGAILAKMVTDSRKQSHYGGVAFYNYSALFSSKSSVMQTEKENLLKLFGKT